MEPNRINPSKIKKAEKYNPAPATNQDKSVNRFVFFILLNLWNSSIMCFAPKNTLSTKLALPQILNKDYSPKESHSHTNPLLTTLLVIQKNILILVLGIFLI